jgi:2-keto-4-pentenoate hydratase/2-oxohepta-3-ene-1,7-dioic acid hydratase in catechol pathway
LDPDSLQWRSPVAEPSKIVGVAINNKIGQMLAYRPFENPAFFLKPATCLIGHQQPVEVYEDYRLTHPEPEMAVIIGKSGRHISKDDALDHVFGYSIFNDITSPGLKERDSLHVIPPAEAKGRILKHQTWRKAANEEDARDVLLTYHALSKGCDTFGPMGPYIVTKDEIADPNNLAVNTYHKDKLVFEDSTANLTFSVQHIIWHISKYMTLNEGDVISCGTAMKPVEGTDYETISDWDMQYDQTDMKIEIEGLGILQNPVKIMG